MPSRDIHSRDGGTKVRDLLSSFFANMLLGDNYNRPIYLISPWLSDFKLLDNRLGQFKDLFGTNTEVGDNPYILFSEVLIEASLRAPIRVITWPDEISKAFAVNFNCANNIHVSFEKAQTDHQKGLLSDVFYFEGSMNFTYSGVYKNKEKVTCNVAYDSEGNCKINEAYLEFERLWDNLQSRGH